MTEFTNFYVFSVNKTALLNRASRERKKFCSARIIRRCGTIFADNPVTSQQLRNSVYESERRKYRNGPAKQHETLE